MHPILNANAKHYILQRDGMLLPILYVSISLTIKKHLPVPPV